LNATGFAEGVINVVFVEVIRCLLVLTSHQREIFGGDKRE
jgi:hypothetical protein